MSELCTFPVELRVADLSERIVEGVVVPYDETTYLVPDPERFLPGSLTRTIKDRGNRIKLYRGHEHRDAYGTPVSWDPDHAAGLFAQFRITRLPRGDEMLAELGEGLLDAFSIGFEAKRERRAADGVREIVEAKLWEVSLAPLGAYDGAKVLAVRTPSVDDLPDMPAVNFEPLPVLHRLES
jgi:HK97 family phage prohead protease